MTDTDTDMIPMNERPFVIVESPFAGTPAEVQRNLQYLHAALADCRARGEIPFASHGFFTYWLDDKDAGQRAWGINAGLEIGRALLDDGEDGSDSPENRVAVYTDLGMSPGMLSALQHWVREGTEIEFRRLPQWQEQLSLPLGDAVDDLVRLQRLQALARRLGRDSVSEEVGFAVRKYLRGLASEGLI